MSDQIKYERLLDFLKNHNPKITFGIVFSKQEGRKHRLWCGSPEKCAFRVSLKQTK